MRVLIVHSQLTGKGQDLMGGLWSLALDEMGIEHQLFDHESMVLRGVQRKRILSTGLNTLAGNRAANILNGWDPYRGGDRGLIEQVRNYRPDLVLVSKGETIRPQLVQEMRQLPECPLVVNWMNDNPFWYPVSFSAIPDYDYYFVKDSYIVTELQKMGAKNVRYLPLGCAPSVYHPVELTPKDIEVYGSSVAFIGDLNLYRARVLEALQDLDMKLWGIPVLSGIGPDSWIHARRQEYRPVWGDEFSKIVCASKVNLNITRTETDIFGVGSRIFQIAACGGFQVIDKKPEVAELFRVGEEIVWFETRDELRELVLYYLEHPNERGIMAQRACRRAREEHSYRRRLERLFEMCGMQVRGYNLRNK